MVHTFFILAWRLRELSAIQIKLQNSSKHQHTLRLHIDDDYMALCLVYLIFTHFTFQWNSMIYRNRSIQNWPTFWISIDHNYFFFVTILWIFMVVTNCTNKPWILFYFIISSVVTDHWMKLIWFAKYLTLYLFNGGN